MLKFIKVTSRSSKNNVYINIAQIGDVYEYENGTIIGVLTHNNGGFKVTENVEEVMKLIEKATNSSVLITSN
jgi:sulfite reductase alpha subunit-like flavoprotein